MLEKPSLDEPKLIACLRDEFGVDVHTIAFLPIGADFNTAVYRAYADGGDYFVKLRRGGFNDVTVMVPHLLHERGMNEVIPPLTTRTGALWAGLDEYAVTLSPFVAGLDGHDAGLTDDQWRQFGRAIKGLHTVELPPELGERIPRETFSGRWRDQMRGFLAQVERETFSDPSAAGMAALLRDNRDTVSELVSRAERLAAELKEGMQSFALCHADAHAWNLLIEQSGKLWLVDWDTLIHAPKERDLMFPGSGLFFDGRSPADQEALFYQGYGETEIDRAALAYYRCERIVQDIAAYCEMLLLTDAGGADRDQSLSQIAHQFTPGQVVEIALGTLLPP